MSKQEEAKPRGRRPGVGSTRGAVLAAARARFAREGFTATTIRLVATDAGVDPSQVMQFFRSKDELFAAVMEIPLSVLQRFDEAFDGDDIGIGERVVGTFFATWEGQPHDSEPLIAILRGAIVNDQARAQLAEFIQSRWASGADRSADESGALRLGLALSMLVGVAVSRNIIGVPTVTSADHDTLVANLAPVIEQLLVPRC